MLYKYCTNILKRFADILLTFGKHAAKSILQNQCKCCTNIVQILSKYYTYIVQRLPKSYTNIAQILYKSYKRLWKNCADIFLTFDKHGANIMQY